MKPLRLLLTIIILFTIGSSVGSNRVEPSGIPVPAIDVQCSVHDIHDDPPEMEAMVKFEWQATNASYVLIKGHDNLHHPLTGAIDKSRGGEYTFLAVAGNRVARQPKMCRQKFTRGPGIHGWIVSVTQAEGDSKAYFADAMVITISTSFSKAEIQSRIAQLLSQTYGITAISSDSGGDDLFLYATEFGFHDSLCDHDQCKGNGIELKRKVGFDIWVEKESQQKKEAARYRIHIQTNVIVRPAVGNVEWGTDPDSKAVGVPVAIRVADAIAQLFG